MYCSSLDFLLDFPDYSGGYVNSTVFDIISCFEITSFIFLKGIRSGLNAQGNFIYVRTIIQIVKKQLYLIYTSFM
jgi:hypothetical protein